MARFPFYQQLDSMDCGPSCLRMISKYYGRNFSLQYLRDQCHISREGVSMLGISDAAETIGFRTQGVRIQWGQLASQAPLPCIVHWKQKHFIVVYKIINEKVFVADPMLGLITYRKNDFLKGWISTLREGEEQGLCLLLQPAPLFYKKDSEREPPSSISFLYSYLHPYRRFIGQLIAGIVFGSLIQLIFPFLTQALVDVGISNQDLGFIYLVLLAQMVLFISRTTVEYIRNWILLHLSSRINVALVSDFLARLMKLPIAFFNARNTGDLLQRIQDHRRIEEFLTTSSLSLIFSFVSFLIMSLVLAWYHAVVFLLFIGGTALYVGWIILFMKKRKVLDHRKFEQLAENQNMLVQLISGMQEIKLNNCEKQRRWEWEELQARMFHTNVNALALMQSQQSGALFINETKNILITFYAATAVMGGGMTLGMMLAVQYIIGQMNAPLLQLINFFHASQDATTSLERLREVHVQQGEEDKGRLNLNVLPENRDIHIRNVSYQYEGPHSPFAIRNIEVVIPQGKVTAIVGTSGSGKTTLIKLILDIFNPTEGDILIGETPLRDLSLPFWRSQCGVVLQDGFLFSDTIARNIAIADESIDKDRLLYAVKMANIRNEIEELPLAYNTKIGAEGIGLSQGQKQRILIARAIYKDPQILLFDEATNALDTTNERIIMKNLQTVFHQKTVLVVAHRLSTVKDADQILVLDKGGLAELGTHEYLIRLKGAYYNLVKNQLEIGNE